MFIIMVMAKDVRKTASARLFKIFQYKMYYYNVQQTVSFM